MPRPYAKLIGFLNRNSDKSLEQLDGEDWGNPESALTDLVRRCLLARRKPIRDMPVDDMRCLIGQGIGLQYLVPGALDLIERNPLDETDVGYPGALFCAVLRIKNEFWQEWPEMEERVAAVLDAMTSPSAFVEKAADQFRANTGRYP